MNNKGFTLVELLMTIVLLAVIIMIAGPSIFNALKSGKQESYGIMISNIKTASITYFEECKYHGSGINCTINNNKVTVTLQELVDYGFLTATSECNDNSCVNVIKNPKDQVDIGACQITIEQITKEMGRVEYHITSNSTDASCPQGDLGSVN